MIDFHCHLDLFKNPIDAISCADKSGAYILSVTNTPKAYPTTARLAKNCKRIRTAVGLHPQIAHLRQSELPLFDHLLDETNYVGEIGLDGGKDYSKFVEIQASVFSSILKKCAEKGGKILSIHSRHAASKVLDHLEKNPNSGTPILHWFSGSVSELNRAIDLGCWFSIGEPMLRSSKGRAHIAKMPQCRVLTETDAPFASGEDIVKSLKHTIEALGHIWNISSIETEKKLNNNLRFLVK